MWNCGDDFIAFGVSNLIRNAADFPINFIAYNRAPELHQLRISSLKFKHNDQEISLNLKQFNNTVLWALNNSWSPDLDLSLIDYVIFAGTPEWLGSMVEPLNSAIIRSETAVPWSYLGVGVFEKIVKLKFSELSRLDQLMLKGADYISVRDQKAQSLLEPVQSDVLPCPALFASKTTQQRRSKKKLALCGQGMHRRQKIDPKTFEFTVRFFKRLIDHYDCTLVCHYIDDLYALRHLNIPALYSYDAKDYLEIYKQFDLNITTRVHGAGLCASLGVPSIVVKHSERSGTVQGFKSCTIEPSLEKIDEYMDMVASFNVSQKSEDLIEHKNKYQAVYIDKIKQKILPSFKP